MALSGEPDMTDLGKLLIGLGLALGRVPGDMIYRGKNTTFYFPLATSIVLSVVLSIVMWILSHWRK